MLTVDHLIASYLREKGHLQTLLAFSQETDTDYDHEEIVSHPSFEPLASIVEDRKLFGVLNKNRERLTLEGHPLAQSLTTTPGRFNAESATTYSTRLAALAISAHVTPMTVGKETIPVLLLALANKQIVMINTVTHQRILTLSLTFIAKVVRGIPETGWFLACGMDGKMRLFEVEGSITNPTALTATMRLDHQLHLRIVVDLKLLPVAPHVYAITSMGWDRGLSRWELDLEKCAIQLVGTTQLLSAPTCMEMVEVEGEIVVCVCRVDASVIEVYAGACLGLVYKISLNDAEFSAGGFYPMALCAKQKEGHTFLAVATNHVPYMRVVVVSLDSFKARVTEGSLGEMSRLEVIHNYPTTNPQDKYSCPALRFSPTRDHVYIGNCDDGVVRVLNLGTGMVKEIGKAVDGTPHAGKGKCFDVYGTTLDHLVSCGTDHMLLMW